MLRKKKRPVKSPRARSNLIHRYIQTSQFNSNNAIFIRPAKDKEYNISRGIDFRNVNNVINFDFPQSTKSYIHRVGRYKINIKI